MGILVIDQVSKKNIEISFLILFLHSTDIEDLERVLLYATLPAVFRHIRFLMALVAQSDMHLTGDQEVTILIPSCPKTFFCRY